MKRRPIKSLTPIPTTYTDEKGRTTLFRSKLEAKWAHVLDHTPTIGRWEYEPYQYTKHSPGEVLTPHPDFVPQNLGPGSMMVYSPDFGAWYQGKEYILEIKPNIPTEAYIHFVSSFNIGKYLIIAGWYPNFSVHSSDKEATKKFVEILFEENSRFIRANQHRFDLKG